MALRLVKDELCSVGGLSIFKITKSTFQSVKGSYTRYQEYPEAKKKVKVDQEQIKKEKEQEKEEQVEKETNLNQDISFTKNCIKQLESTLSEANQDFSNVLKAPAFVKEQIVKAHALINMYLERKRNLLLN